jgi:hypothetical protein
MIEHIKEEILAKIKWLEWNNHPRSLELIEWLKQLLTLMEEKPAPIQKEIKVELPEEEVKEEKKSAPKRKITFKKK